jgi:hypothetical protein
VVERVRDHAYCIRVDLDYLAGLGVAGVSLVVVAGGFEQGIQQIVVNRVGLTALAAGRICVETRPARMNVRVTPSVRLVL